MSDAASTGFAQFVPGFDFLQTLAKSSAHAMPQVPNMANWMAPTLSVEELDKRISELKTVHFWLDQNTKALAATVQALEVQKMTLATLQSMNLNLADLANAFTPKPADSAARAQAPASAAEPTAAQAPKSNDEPAQATSTPPRAGLSDPMQLWGALTQQFQTIAASALADMGKAGAQKAAEAPAKSAAKTGPQPSEGTATRQAPAQKKPVKRAAPRAAAQPRAQNTAPAADAPLRGLRQR